MAKGSVIHRVPVRARLWGLTDADRKRAFDHAQRSPWRNGWDFVEVDDNSDDTCPLNLKDPKALAAQQGYGWAYVVYHAEATR